MGVEVTEEVRSQGGEEGSKGIVSCAGVPDRPCCVLWDEEKGRGSFP